MCCIVFSEKQHAYLYKLGMANGEVLYDLTDNFGSSWKTNDFWEAARAFQYLVRNDITPREFIGMDLGSITCKELD